LCRSQLLSVTWNRSLCSKLPRQTLKTSTMTLNDTEYVVYKSLFLIRVPVQLVVRDVLVNRQSSQHEPVAVYHRRCDLCSWLKAKKPFQRLLARLLDYKLPVCRQPCLLSLLAVSL
jgi:hypothetical protein